MVKRKEPKNLGWKLLLVFLFGMMLEIGVLIFSSDYRTLSIFLIVVGSIGFLKMIFKLD